MMRTYRLEHVAEAVVGGVVSAVQRVVDAARTFRGPGSDWDVCLEEGAEQLAEAEETQECWEPRAQCKCAYLCGAANRSRKAGR